MFNPDVLFEENLTIESERLFIRPTNGNDAESLLPMYSDERIYTFRPGIKRDNLLKVSKALKNFDRMRAEKDSQYLVIEDKTTGDTVGLLEVFNIDSRVEQTEIGYTISPLFWGKGYASESVNLLSSFLFLRAGFNRLRSTVHVDNTASRKVMEKCSFTLEGTERQGEFWQGIGFVNIYRYAKLREDLEEQ